MDCAFDDSTVCGWKEDPRDTHAKWALVDAALCVDRPTIVRLRQRSSLSARLWSPTVSEGKGDLNNPELNEFADYSLDEDESLKLPSPPVQCLRFTYFIDFSRSEDFESELSPSLSMLRHSTG